MKYAFEMTMEEVKEKVVNFLDGMAEAENKEGFEVATELFNAYLVLNKFLEENEGH